MKVVGTNVEGETLVDLQTPSQQGDGVLVDSNDRIVLVGSVVRIATELGEWDAYEGDEENLKARVTEQTGVPS